MNIQRRRTYQAGILQSRAYRKLQHFMTTQLAADNLSMMEWGLLGVVYDKHSIGITVGKLASLLDVDISHITNLSHGLIDRELLVSEPQASDRRIKKIYITDKGKCLVETIEKRLRKSMKQWLRPVGVKNIIQYVVTLKKIAELEDYK